MYCAVCFCTIEKLIQKSKKQKETFHPSATVGTGGGNKHNLATCFHAMTFSMLAGKHQYGTQVHSSEFSVWLLISWQLAVQNNGVEMLKPGHDQYTG